MKINFITEARTKTRAFLIHLNIHWGSEKRIQTKPSNPLQSELELESEPESEPEPESYQPQSEAH